MAQTADTSLAGRVAALEAAVRSLTATNWTDNAAVQQPDGTVVPLSEMATAPAAAQAAAAAAATAGETAEQAIADAGDAQATADGKVTTWMQPDPPAGLTDTDVGDLWFDTDDNNRMYRWDGTTWAESADQRTAAALTAAQQASEAATAATGAVATKTTTYYQTSSPPTTGRVVGDLWVDTDDQNRLYAWNGTTWDDARDQLTVQANTTAGQATSIAGSRNRVFTQASQPTGGGYVTGDLWIDTATGNRISSWTGAAWQVQLLNTAAFQANAVTAAVLAGDAVNGKTITGAILQTAVAGRRTVLGERIDGLVFYSGTPNEGHAGLLWAAADTSGGNLDTGQINVMPPSLAPQNSGLVDSLMLVEGVSRNGAVPGRVKLQAGAYTTAGAAAANPAAILLVDANGVTITGPGSPTAGRRVGRDTGPVTMATLGAGFTNRNTGCWYRVIDGMVWFGLNITKAATTTTGTIFTLPAGTWPGVDHYFLPEAGGVIQGEVAVRSASGIIQLVSATANAGTTLLLNAAFPAA
jgi:hypothetical protein